MLGASDVVPPFVTRSNLPKDKPVLLKQFVGIPDPIQLYLEPELAVNTLMYEYTSDVFGLTGSSSDEVLLSYQVQKGNKQIK